MNGYDWKTGLPMKNVPTTIFPAALEKYQDKTACALRVKGFDSQGRLCHYHHAYALNCERFDEEGFYDENEAYRQEFTAWRLNNGGWLVRKYEAGAHGDCASRLVKPEYWISETFPSEQ